MAYSRLSATMYGIRKEQEKAEKNVKLRLKVKDKNSDEMYKRLPQLQATGVHIR